MIKPPLVTFCSILGLFTVAPTFAGSVGSPAPRSVQGVAEREIVRRQEAVGRAQTAIETGNKARKARDYEVAVQQYRLAVDLLPESQSTHQLRSQALKLFCDASVKLAEQRISEGRYKDAETIAKTVLEDRYNPACRDAIELLAHLEQPDYYNKTITPKHHANVEQVRQLLVEAKGFYDTGRYDKAYQRYDQVLNIDPYNSTARKGQEQVNKARQDYAIDAYNETRSELLWKVQKSWEIQPRKYGTGPVAIWETGAQSQNNTAQITAKLNRIIIPRVEFRDATVPEAIEFLKKKSRELDVNEPNADRKGVNIVLQLDNPGGFGAPAPAHAPAEAAIPGLDPAPAGDASLPPAAPAINPNETRITLSLSNVPLAEVLRYITQLAGMKVKIDPYAVAIVPVTVITDTLLTKEYKVPPGFLTNAPVGDQAGPSPTLGQGDKNTIGRRLQAKEYFESHGVQFPPGASATFVASSSRLLVRNTQDQLDLIDTIVEAIAQAVPSQVEIEAKFVEITQNNLKELSFDWLLGNFNFSRSVEGAGGTSGVGNTIDAANFPFLDNNGNPIGGNPLTGGNRTGVGSGGAISANAIDALLFPSTGLTSAAPGIFGVAGVLTDPQFQLVIRAMNQKKGVDLLSSPRITTKSGQRAKIEIIREFRYPTEFSPPQIPQTVGATQGTSGGGSGSIPVTPTTPTAFETRNTGVTLDVEPVVGPDGSTIDLNLQPEVVEFEGFINYGSPILTPENRTPWQDLLTGDIFTVITPPSVVTPNVINQPIFSTRRVTTSVSVWDGQTVALGGLMREDVQKVEDKVPILGDIPLAGRLFRSSVDQHIKRNLVIFVTARLINPAGEPLNHEEEADEVIEPMVPEQLPGDAPLPLFSK